MTSLPFTATAMRCGCFAAALLGATAIEAAEPQAPGPAAGPPPASTLAPESAHDAPKVTDKRPLAEEAAHVKPGTGFVFTSEDGDFSFAPRLRAQFAYALQKAPGADAAQSVQIRRARLQFKGNYYGRNNRFKVELALSPADVGMSDTAGPTTSVLLDWYLDFTHLRDLTLRIGQYKIPHTRQRVVSSGDLELVDRSIVNAEFNLDRDIGFDIRSEDFLGLDRLRYYVGVYAGEGRNTRGTYDLGMSYLGRIELLPFGSFEDYQEGDFERLGSPRLSLGVGVARVFNARRNQGIVGDIPSDGGTTDVSSITWDAVLRYAGWSLTTEWAWRDGQRDPGDAGEVEAPRDGIGGMVQLSYLLPALPLQFAARGGLIRAHGDESSLEDQDELGGGISYYFAEHPFKLQADYFRLGEDVQGSTRHIHQVRVQLQASY